MVFFIYLFAARTYPRFGLLFVHANSTGTLSSGSKYSRAACVGYAFVDLFVDTCTAASGLAVSLA